MSKQKSKSRILEIVHETAKDMYDAGVMDAVTMKEFDSMCLPPVKPLGSKEIKAIRKREHVSQPVLAAYLNVTKSTVTQWEQGEKKPSGPSLKLLNLIERKGLEVLA